VIALRYRAGIGMKNLVITVILVGVLGYFGAKFYLHHEVSSNLDSAISSARPRRVSAPQQLVHFRTQIEQRRYIRRLIKIDL